MARPCPWPPCRRAQGIVGIGDDESLAHGVRADGLEQKALAGAVTTDQKAEARAAVGDETQIGEQGADFDLAPYGDVRKADARDNAALERVENDGGDALGTRGAVDAVSLMV